MKKRNPYTVTAVVEELAEQNALSIERKLVFATLSHEGLIERPTDDRGRSLAKGWLVTEDGYAFGFRQGIFENNDGSASPYVVLNDVSRLNLKLVLMGNETVPSLIAEPSLESVSDYDAPCWDERNRWNVALGDMRNDFFKRHHCDFLNRDEERWD